MREAPLAGIKVLDLSRVLAGPWASQLLGDLGADVVKVERPGAGDDTRAWGPPYLKDEEGRDTDIAAYFLCANRNKRSLTIDLAQPAGQALVRQLAQQADVLLENFKFDGLKQYGLDYASLAALNPRLVYCSLTGFGQSGPYAARAGYDFPKFCAIAGHAEWASDERFATNPQRVKHRAVLIPLLREATVMRTTQDWIAALEAAGVPCGPINRLDQVFADPHVQARGVRI